MILAMNMHGIVKELSLKRSMLKCDNRGLMEN